MKIGITGGIGSGKSYLCDILRNRNIDVFNCDNVAKEIMQSSQNVRQSIISLIGDDSYDGIHPNKKKIASFILASEDNANKINRIVHPEVAKDFIASRCDFMECALLYQSGFDKLVDFKVCVTAPFETRIKRIMKRDNISYGMATKWIECQMPQEEIAKKSDFIIINDGIVHLLPQIEQMLSYYR